MSRHLMRRSSSERTAEEERTYGEFHDGPGQHARERARAGDRENRRAIRNTALRRRGRCWSGGV